MKMEGMKLCDVVSRYTTACDGYVVAEEIVSGGVSFSDEVKQINEAGYDVVDIDYEDIYREKRGLDRLDETEDVHQAIIYDLQKEYEQKINSGATSRLEDAGFSRGAQKASGRRNRA